MIPGLSMAKLIAIGVAVLFVIGLLVTIKIQHANNLVLTAQLNEARTANTGLASQVESLTADKATAEKAAGVARAALAARETKRQTAIQAAQEKVDHAAIPSDDLESPALRAALDSLRRAPSDPAAAAH